MSSSLRYELSWFSAYVYLIKFNSMYSMLYSSPCMFCKMVSFDLRKELITITQSKVEVFFAKLCQNNEKKMKQLCVMSRGEYLEFHLRNKLVEV